MTSILRMTQEERKAIMEANPPEICSVHNANVYFDWDWKGCGFGQFSFSYDQETGEFTAMNEFMSRDSARKFLHALADYIADRVVLLDARDDEPPPPIDSKAEFAQRKKEFEEWQNERRNKRSGVSASKEGGDSSANSNA